MSREVHVQFCERLRGKFPQSTLSVIHCRTEGEAQQILRRLDVRMQACELQLHPTKTRIVYCKDKDRRGDYPNTEFDFLGYTFRGRWIKDRLGRVQCNFGAAVSKKAVNAMREEILHFAPGSGHQCVCQWPLGVTSGQ